jgi:inosine/xanthosine triphosphatase
MLGECRKFRHIAIGLTSDGYVRRHKIYPSLPYEERRAGLERALSKYNLAGRTEIMQIGDEAGGADTNRLADTIIVSGETLEAAGRINRLRRKNGLKPLAIISVPIAYGEDLKKISCQSIYEGKTDLEGKLLKPLLIQAGTDNPAKLKGTSLALRRIFGKKFVLRGCKVVSGVADHPFNSETFDGAANRARRAFASAGGKCDYSAGMESGLFTLRKGMHIDITACCIFDGKDETYGTGMGFVVPEKIAQRIKREKSDLTRVLEEMAGVKDVGRKHGAIGHFSAGVLHRSEQIEQSVLCAFVPRIARAKTGAEY